MIRSALLAAAGAALLSTAASAADLPRREMPPVFTPVPVFTWTGAYIGINAGYAFSEDQTIRTIGNNSAADGTLIPNLAATPPNAGTDTVNNVNQLRRTPAIGSSQEGFAGGGQIGYNFQLTPGNGFVIGVEADAMYTDLNSTRQYLSPPIVQNNFVPDPSTFRQSLDYLGTVRGRIGYAFDRFMIYGTGGFAYGGVTYDAQFRSNVPPITSPIAAATATSRPATSTAAASSTRCRPIPS